MQFYRFLSMNESRTVQNEFPTFKKSILYEKTKHFIDYK